MNKRRRWKAKRRRRQAMFAFGRGSDRQRADAVARSEFVIQRLVFHPDAFKMAMAPFMPSAARS